METEFEVVKMPRNEFDYLAKQLIARCCVQCNQSFKDCDLYTLLDNNMFPTCNLGKNCPYKFIPEKNSDFLLFPKNDYTDIYMYDTVEKTEYSTWFDDMINIDVVAGREYYIFNESSY